MNKSKILFIVWIIGVILLLLGMKYDMRNIFSLITGMIIGGGAVTFLYFKACHEKTTVWIKV